MMVDQRILALQSDPMQVRSVNEFTDSLVRELSAAEGTPGKVLMTELLHASLRRALDIGGAEPKQRFLEALAGNIHKFHLQEQQSLARVFPVEISSEYSNLASFVGDSGGPEDSLPPTAVVAAPGAATRTAASPGGGSPGALGTQPASVLPMDGDGPLAELRRRLATLPSRPGAAAEELLEKLMDDKTSNEVEGADARSRQAFFADLRLSLFKLSESAQKDLVERFQELRIEVARLVDSMTQEISRWLDEEQASRRSGGIATPLFPKLKQLFQAVLSAPFLTTFKHLGSAEKRGKESFLLKLALCLRVVAERAAGEMGGESVLGQAAQLRKRFFHVEGYGELMEDWLQNRVKQSNEEFANRVGIVLGSSPQAVLARLRRTFRPGRWLSLDDPQVEEDLFALFLDDAFPRHVLTNEAIAKVLQRVSSYGGATCDFQIYGSIARLPPAAGSVGRAPPPQDAVEAALLQILQRLPPFPALRRVRSGRYLFGRLEVEFLLRGSTLLAKVVTPSPTEGKLAEQTTAEEFFASQGPEEFPNAAAMAVQASLRSPGDAPTTRIEAVDAPMGSMLAGPTPPPLLPLPAPLPLPTAGPGSGFPNMGLSSLPRGPPVSSVQRFEPYPGAGMTAMAAMGQVAQPMRPPGIAPMGFAGQVPLPGAPPLAPPGGGGGSKFGLEDDEI